MKRYYIKLINSNKWRKLRMLKLSDTPLCECCSAVGKITPATEVHHLKPVEDGVGYEEMKQLAYDYKNLQSICHSCHVEQHILLSSKSRTANVRRNKNLTETFVGKYLEK